VGSLALPTSGTVFFDTQIAIYAVERHPVYAPLIRPLWLAGQAGTVGLAASELIILETLVGPLRIGDKKTEQHYDTLWRSGVIGLKPVSESVLRMAAELRARYNSLRTPDAIHAASAILAEATLLVTNDYNLRQVSELSVAVLNDLLTP
jgi:predicted nucleic acid-binding protein